MKLRPCTLHWLGPVVALLLLISPGCDKKSGDGGSGASDNAEATTGKGNPDAVKAMQDELDKRWLKTRDGWISEYPSRVSIGTGEPHGPESFYRQHKELKFEIEPQDLSESDKLNGVEFRGDAMFSTPARIYGDPNAFGPPKWSEWETITESVTIEKKKGQWTTRSIGFMVSGTKPSESTVSKLK